MKFSPFSVSLAVVMLFVETFSPLALFAEMPLTDVAIVPYLEGKDDLHVLKTTRELTAKLRQDRSLHLLHAEIISDILSYHRGALFRPDQTLMKGEALLESAREDYYSFSYEKAADRLKELHLLLEASSLPLLQRSSLLWEMLLLEGLVAKAQRSDARAKRAFHNAFQLHPTRRLDPEIFPPSIISLMNKVRQEALHAGSASLRVETDPPAQVFLNGALQGETPLAISELPPGRYEIAIRAPKRTFFFETVEVAAGEERTLSQNLRRYKREKREDDPLILGKKIASLLQVDHLYVVTADEGAMFLQPETVTEQKKKKKHFALWGAVGAAAVAAIVGGVAAASSSSSSSPSPDAAQGGANVGAGAVTGSLRIEFQ